MNGSLAPSPARPTGDLFRPPIERLIPRPDLLVAGIFGLHTVVRFGGLWNPVCIPLSMVLIWPLPWLLSPRLARRRMGFRAPVSWRWFLVGPLAALGTLALCTASAWTVFGAGDANWFTRHALVLREALAQAPVGASPTTRFLTVTLPAMLFSPLAEEFLYRGFVLTAVSTRWGYRAGTLVQATAFALVHLAHYGLNPFQPALLAVWLPSTFAAALVFGRIVQKSGSLWPAVASHSLFNLGINAVVFLFLPDLVEV